MDGEVEIETHPTVFDDKMKEPQKYAKSRDWKAFKQFFEADKKALMEPFDLFGNTAIQIATNSKDPELLTQLLEMLSASERWRVLRRKNRQENTVLHMIAYNFSKVEVADVVFKFEMERQSPEEIDDKSEESKRPLLELKNQYGETPVYKAAKHGNLRMLKHMAKRVGDLQMHFQRDFDKTSILHAAVLGQFFETAIWLLRRAPSLADSKDDRGLTCLQILSKMAYAFRSQSLLGTAQKILYYFLPEKGYHHDDDTMKTISWSGRDLESGENQSSKPISANSRINYDIWRFLATGPCEGWDEINYVWKIKMQHKLAEQLVDLLVKRDTSWMKGIPPKPRKLILIPYASPSTHASSSSHENIIYTPLLLASSTGVTEIVERIVDMTPGALFHVSEDGQNILHMAIKHRHLKIYELIEKSGFLKNLAYQISNDGRTALHQAATMDCYKDENHSGDAFELQEELQWFYRVKSIIPTYYIIHCDDADLTARELFDQEHSKMLKNAQKWIKETAQSCSAVAVLVATVVFAAAYTVPGGYETSGHPVFLQSPLFLFFTVMDIVALACSLGSVVIFLSILTSPFRMDEFYKSLPRKLTLGFTLLFFSLTTTMLAFSATILLTVKLQKKWTSTLIYSASFFPVAIFGLMEFPLYMAVQSRLKKIFKMLTKKKKIDQI